MSLVNVLFILFKLTVIVFMFTILVIVSLKILFEPRKGMCKCKARLDGKVVLITGGNSGIGLETAKDLAQRGARVVIASRNDKKSEEAVEEIKQMSGNHKVEYRHLNLRDMDSVREFARNFNHDFGRLDILVNNAGIFSAKNSLSADNIDVIMVINYIGPFLLTHLLLDKLKASKPSRIVMAAVHSRSRALAIYRPRRLGRDL